MRGKAISSGEKKIILNVFKHFKTENSSLIENVVITVTFKVPRIAKHGSKIRPNREKGFNKLDEFNPRVVGRFMPEVFSNIYFFKVEISSKICKTD